MHAGTGVHGAERLLLLDRDGTLNRTLGTRPPNTPCEVDLLPGVASVLSRYAAEGWRLVVVSNQGGVAAGFFSEAQARAVQQRVIELLPVPVAASYLCPHAPDGVVPEYALDCPNRKPKPGFIQAALERFGARAGDCLFVGDSITDRQAAEAAGVPFCWADRFFGRPIDRGLRVEDGRWVQIREARSDDLEAVGRRAAEGTQLAKGTQLTKSVQLSTGAQPGQTLVAAMGGQIVGWRTVSRGNRDCEVDGCVCVDPVYQGIGIEALLRDVLLDRVDVGSVP